MTWFCEACKAENIDESSNCIECLHEHKTNLTRERNVSNVQRRRGSLGVISFILAVIPFIIFLLTALLMWASDEWLSIFKPLMYIFLIFLLYCPIFFEIAAFGLGIIALFKKQNRLFAILGIIISTASPFIFLLILGLGGR